MGTVILGEGHMNSAVYCPDSAFAGDGCKQHSHTWCRQENVHQILCHPFSSRGDLGHCLWSLGAGAQKTS